MIPPGSPLWRAFPWDPGAAEGQRFSAAFVPPSRGVERFDLSDETAGVIYLTESPAHALAEKVQDLRNQTLNEDDLSEGGHRYALPQVSLGADTAAKIVDLCDPATIDRLEIAPDRVAARDRGVTQEIARTLHVQGFAGLRWWSVFFGEWHDVVLFRDRLGTALDGGVPQRVELGDPELAEAARALGIRIM